MDSRQIGEALRASVQAPHHQVNPTSSDGRIGLIAHAVKRLTAKCKSAQAGEGVPFLVKIMVKCIYNMNTIKNKIVKNKIT